MVFSNASNALLERLCTSSIIYIFFGNTDGRYLVEATRSLISEMELCDAASNSTQSKVVLFKSAMQFLH